MHQMHASDAVHALCLICTSAVTMRWPGLLSAQAICQAIFSHWLALTELQVAQLQPKLQMLRLYVSAGTAADVLRGHPPRQDG